MAEQKNKGGRPKGSGNNKKELKDVITKTLEDNAKIIKVALESNDLTAKEKAALYKDLLPYGASKKTDDKKEIPDHLKYVKIVIRGYKPGEDPYADEDKPDEDEESDD